MRIPFGEETWDLAFVLPQIVVGPGFLLQPINGLTVDYLKAAGGLVAKVSAICLLYPSSGRHSMRDASSKCLET